MTQQWRQYTGRTLAAGVGIGMLLATGTARAGTTSCPRVPFQDGQVTFVPATGVANVNVLDGDQVLAADDQLVVAVDGDISREALLALQDALASLQCTVVGYASGSHVLQVDGGPGRDLAALAGQIALLAHVRYALPNELVEVVNAGAPFTVPGEGPTPPYLLTVVPTPSAFAGDYWIPLMRADDAWAKATGSPAAPIGLVGPGVDPDAVLAPGRLQAFYPGGVPGSAVADQGTFAAGLAAGDGARLDDAVGMAWDTRVVYVTLKQPGSALQLLTDVIGAVETAIVRGAHVVNVPATFTPGRNIIGFPSAYTRALRRFRMAMTPTVRYAAERDVLVCFAAGNGGEGASQTHLPPVDLNVDGDLFDIGIDAGITTAATATVLTDATKTWTPDEHAGRLCRIVDGPAGGYVRPIIGNTATSLTVKPDWPVPPGAGAAYAIDIDAALTTTETGVPNFVPLAVFNDDVLLPPGAPVDPAPWSTSAVIVGATAAQVNVFFAQPFATTLLPPAGSGGIPIINPLPFGKLAGFSHFGAVLDLVAPGLGVSYGAGVYGGTGLASALVTGTAGLVRGAHPDLTAEEVRVALLDTANPFPFLTIGVGVGHGLVDAASALALADAIAAVPPADAFPVTLEAGDAVEVPITFDLPAEPAGGSVDYAVEVLNDGEGFAVGLPIGGTGAAGETVTMPLTLQGVREETIRSHVYQLMVWVRTAGGELLARVPIEVTVPAEPCP